MLKINQEIKNKFDFLLNILVLILIIFFNRTNIVYGTDINWFEVSRTPAGVQYLDRDSIDIEEKGIIELTTKYIKIAPSTSKEIAVSYTHLTLPTKA